MAELRATITPAPEQARRLLADALPALVPGWRPLAENVLGEQRRIDWVGRDRDGRAVLVLSGRADAALALVGDGLAQLAWLGDRLADWRQLAPESGLRPEAGAVAWLLAPDFGPAAVAAARACDAGLRLARLRWVANDSGTAAWIEPLAPTATDDVERTANGFRTGLAAEDLDLTPEEREAFRDAGSAD